MIVGGKTGVLDEKLVHSPRLSPQHSESKILWLFKEPAHDIHQTSGFTENILRDNGDETTLDFSSESEEIIWIELYISLNHFPEMNQPQFAGSLLVLKIFPEIWMMMISFETFFPVEVVSPCQFPNKNLLRLANFQLVEGQSWNLFGGGRFSSWRKVMQILP